MSGSKYLFGLNLTRMVSGTPIAGNAPPLLSPGGLIPAYI
jgi:hypothetical protein